MCLTKTNEKREMQLEMFMQFTRVTLKYATDED